MTFCSKLRNYCLLLHINIERTGENSDLIDVRPFSVSLHNSIFLFHTGAFKLELNQIILYSCLHLSEFHEMLNYILLYHILLTIIYLPHKFAKVIISPNTSLACTYYIFIYSLTFVTHKLLLWKTLKTINSKYLWQ